MNRSPHLVIRTFAVGMVLTLGFVSTVTASASSNDVLSEQSSKSVELRQVATVPADRSGMSVQDVEVVASLHEALVSLASDDFYLKAHSPIYPGFVEVVNTSTGQIEKTVAAGYQPAQTVYDQPDNRVFVLNFGGYAKTSSHRDIEVFNATTMKLETTIYPPYQHEANANFGPMIFDAGLDRLYVSMGNSQIDVINGKTLQVQSKLPRSYGVGTAIDATRQLMFGAIYNGAVWVMNAKNNEIVNKGIGVGHNGCYQNNCQVGQPSGTDGLTYDPINHLLYAANANDGAVAVLDTTSDKVTGLIEPGLGQGAFMTVVDAPADIVYVLNDGEGGHSGISVINGRNLKVLDNLTFPAGSNALVTMDIDPTAHRLYVTTDPNGATKPATTTKSVVDVLSTCSVDKWVASTYHVSDITSGC